MIIENSVCFYADIATESNVTSYLLCIVVEAFRGLPVTGKGVIGITTIVCSPTLVRFATGNRKGLVPAARKRGKERERERERERDRQREREI